MKNKKIIKSVLVICILVLILIGIWFLYSKLDNKDVTSINEDVDWSKYGTTKIQFSENDINIDGEGVKLNNNKITITNSGTYYLSGDLKDGNIIVDAKNCYVQIILNNTSITSKEDAPIYVKKSKLTLINVAENTKNVIKDTTSYPSDTETSSLNAAIYSKSNLIISGKGKLTVKSNYEDAIACTDGLKIDNITLNITSNDDGIRGKDYVIINNSTITINASSNGIKSTKENDTNKGYITVSNSIINITSNNDGIESSNNIIIYSGKFKITTGGGSVNSSKTTNWGNWNNNTSTDTKSAKAIKATNSIVIEDGSFNIDSSDDSIHSNSDVTIKNGTFNISSGDDGIHADSSINISGGNINITKSYEGIEATNITISNGNISVVATDDGINICGGNDSSAMGRPGENTYDDSSNRTLKIDGGSIYVDSQGDGIDINGSGTINGGTIIINGPTDDGNGALDYDGTLVVNGGMLISAGSSGMLQTPTNTSMQNTLSVIFDSTQSANTLVNIQDSDGNEILTFKPNKTFDSIVISTSSFITSKTYRVYLGGTDNNEETNGLYKNGAYTQGTLYSSATISNVVTQIGNSKMNQMRPNR